MWPADWLLTVVCWTWRVHWSFSYVFALVHFLAILLFCVLVSALVLFILILCSMFDVCSCFCFGFVHLSATSTQLKSKSGIREISIYPSSGTNTESTVSLPIFQDEFQRHRSCPFLQFIFVIFVTPLAYLQRSVFIWMGCFHHIIKLYQIRIDVWIINITPFAVNGTVKNF